MNKHEIIYYFYKDLFNFFYYPNNFYLEKIPIFKTDNADHLKEKNENNKNIFFCLECK